MVVGGEFEIGENGEVGLEVVGKTIPGMAAVSANISKL